MPIPFFIALAKARATAFRQEVKLLSVDGAGRTPWQSWKDTSAVIRYYHGDPLDRAEHSPADVPSAIVKALIWANSVPGPSAADIRQARPDLEAALSEWGGAWHDLGRVLRTEGLGEGPREWLRDAVSESLARHRQAQVSLKQGWPLTSSDDEGAALAEMKAGRAVEFDEAFALLAGVTKEEWQRKVAAHQVGRGAAGGQD